MAPLLVTLLSACSDAAAEVAQTAAEEPGWFASLLDKLFDPAWNEANRTTIWPVILCILALTGVGLPTPEDIWLTLAGFTTYKQSGDQFVFWHFVITFFACAIANLIGDSGAWWLGKTFGFGIRDRFRFMKRMLSDKRLKKVQGWFDNYGSFTVFLGRQVAGIRFVTFFTAGTMRMPLSRFLLFDFLGCLISIPVWLTLGALASIHGKEWLQQASTTAGGGFLAGGVLLLVVFLVVVKIRAVRRRREDTVVLGGDVKLALSTRAAAAASAEKPEEKTGKRESAPPPEQEVSHRVVESRRE